MVFEFSPDPEVERVVKSDNHGRFQRRGKAAPNLGLHQIGSSSFRAKQPGAHREGRPHHYEAACPQHRPNQGR